MESLRKAVAWLDRNRRLSKGDERLTSSSETVVYLASIRMLLRCLAKTT